MLKTGLKVAIEIIEQVKNELLKNDPSLSIEEATYKAFLLFKQNVSEM